MIKNIWKFRECRWRSLPYPEPNVCKGDGELVRTLNQGKLGELDLFAKDGDALNVHTQDGYTPLH